MKKTHGFVWYYKRFCVSLHSGNERKYVTTNKSICFFYPNESGGAANASDSSVAVLGSQNQISTISERFLDLLEKKDQQIDRLLSLMESQKGGN